ncbi:MAG TPA: hypothetical protein VFK24_11645 [Gammaproteobacteria bacterium]|nr:hypothetical protein [Gammaproteobacteria bacterium]
MSALLVLFGCLVLGVLVARFARPPANSWQGRFCRKTGMAWRN